MIHTDEWGETYVCPLRNTFAMFWIIHATECIPSLFWTCKVLNAHWFKRNSDYVECVTRDPHFSWILMSLAASITLLSWLTGRLILFFSVWSTLHYLKLSRFWLPESCAQMALWRHSQSEHSSTRCVYVHEYPYESAQLCVCIRAYVSARPYRWRSSCSCGSATITNSPEKE